MILKETTVFFKYDSPIEHGYADRVSYIIEMRKGFLFSKNELIELLGSVWCKAQTSTDNNSYCDMYGEKTVYDDDIEKEKEQFINSLFNTEENEK